MTNKTIGAPIITDPPCEEHPDLYFPESEQVEEYDAAVALCQGCSGKQACLVFALDNKIQYGVWGGKTPVDRGIWIHGAPRNEEMFNLYINTEKYYTNQQLAKMLGRRTPVVLELVRAGVLHKPDRIIHQRSFWKKDAVDLDALRLYLKQKKRR